CSILITTEYLRYTSLTYLFFSSVLSSTPHIYTLSLHDALPISLIFLDILGTDFQTERHTLHLILGKLPAGALLAVIQLDAEGFLDRKSTRLNSSHVSISYAVFCLKKKTNTATI